MYRIDLRSCTVCAMRSSLIHLISAKKYVQQHKSAFYPCIDKVDCACRTHDYACAASSVGCCEADDEALEFIAKKYGKTWKARRIGTAMSFSKSRRKC